MILMNVIMDLILVQGMLHVTTQQAPTLAHAKVDFLEMDMPVLGVTPAMII